MHLSKAGLAVVATLLTKGIAAGPHHGHFHKRVLDIVTDWDVVYQTVTDVVWVTVTGEDGSVTTTTTPANAAATTSSVVVSTTHAASAAQPIVQKVSSAAPVVHSSAPAPVPFTSSSVVAAPASTSTSSIVAPAAPVVATSPVATPTTLATVHSSSAIAASTSSASVAPISTTPTSTSSSKRGLSFNEAALLDMFSSSSLINWCYNWGSSADGTVPDNFEYIPMLWGLDDWATSVWSANAKAAIANGATAVLSFNEPDNPQQSSLAPSAAAVGYQQYMNPLSGSAQLGAPAVTNGGAPEGLTWLGEFLDACNGQCDIDFVPIHWYDSATNYAYFKDYVQEAYVAGGNRTLWITEFGATGSTEQQVEFLQIVMPWLDQQEYVGRYAYFMDDVGVLLQSATELSSLGSTFMDYTSSTINSLIADI